MLTTGGLSAEERLWYTTAQRADKLESYNPISKNKRRITAINFKLLPPKGGLSAEVRLWYTTAQNIEKILLQGRSLH